MFIPIVTTSIRKYPLLVSLKLIERVKLDGDHNSLESFRKLGKEIQLKTEVCTKEICENIEDSLKKNLI